MKFNKWTVGLVAVGAVSVASVAQADEKPSSLMTAVSSTILSGYVDTSAEWNPGTGNQNVPNYAYNSPGKADGFNLDSVKITLEKPLDESQWAAGYKVDLFFGPDANTLGTASSGLSTSDFAIKQAYVSLRTPICNGIDWKLGVWDTIIGYESTEDPNNPNFTRSYGYTLEPTTHTGLQGTYKFCDAISVTAGVANTTGPVIGGGTGFFGTIASGSGITSNPGRANPPKAESYKTYMGSISVTAPNDWGFLAGSSLSAGVINGWGGNTQNTVGTITSGTGSTSGAGANGVQDNFYVGATLNTPVTGLKLGASYDYASSPNQSYTVLGNTLNFTESWANDVALYASFQATEKLSFNARGEYLWQSKGVNAEIVAPNKVFALTGTIQYDLWKNVLSRLEVRWDHQAGADAFTGGSAYGGNFSSESGADKHNSYLLAANIIYKF